jgi:hypothetical protein
MNLKEKIPQSVSAVLWSYDLNMVDLTANCELIIKQVLNFGSKEATDWLFRTYSKDEITSIASLIPTREWDEKSLALWSLCLGIKPISRAERILHAR